METKEKIKFEIGKTYKGCGLYGYNQVKIIKVTDKTVTFQHNMGTNRAKLLNLDNSCHMFRFRAWMFEAQPWTIVEERK